MQRRMRWESWPFWGSLLIAFTVAGLMIPVKGLHAATCRRVFGRKICTNGVRPFSQGLTGSNFVTDEETFSPLSQGGVSRVGSRSFNSFGLLNQNGFEDIPGFSNLVRSGNALLERNSRGEVRRLLIDRAGRLLGASEATTVRQAREFFILNRDKLNAAQRQSVDQFLLRNGGASDGKVTIDLKSIVLPPNIPPQRAMEAALASLNFLLNTIQTDVKLKVTPNRIQRDGSVSLDLSPFFRGEALALIKAADPTFACTGKIRLDRLAAFAMDPNNYYRFINAPRTRAELSLALGVIEDKTATRGNKMLVGTDANGRFESGPTRNLRVLEVQPTRRSLGGSCYRSLDIIDNNAPGEQSASRDVTKKGIFWTHDAEEWLCLGRNGMMQGFLFNAKGELQARAPSEIATGASGTVGPAISAVVACLDCHAGGFIGGGKRKDLNGEFYTDSLNKIPPTSTVIRDQLTGRTLSHRDFFFRNNAQYRQRADFDSQIFLRAQQETGSLFTLDGLQPYPLLPSLIGKFNQPLKAADAARELGTSEAAAQKLMGKGGVTRSEFDAHFCNLKRGVNGPVSEFQSRSLLGSEIFQSPDLRHFGR